MAHDPESADPTFLLSLAAGCEPCTELVSGLRDVDFEERLVAVIRGPDKATLQLRTELSSAVAIVDGEAAERLTKALKTDVTPSAFQLEGDRITGKAIPRGAADLLAFAAARPGYKGKLNLTEVNGSAI